MIYQHHIIYKTTNLQNKMYYIGRHSTNDLNDSYLGSGKRLIFAIKVYGKENFNREILWVFDNYDDMMNKEKELINGDVMYDAMSYNIAPGGEGVGSGEDHPLYGKIPSKETKQKQSEKAKGRIIPRDQREKQSKTRKEKCYGENGGNVKLTEQKVIEIKSDERLNQYGGICELAKENGVGRTTISAIRNGKIWKHVPFGVEIKPIKKEASFQGESAPNSKFTKEEVLDIKNDPRLYQWGGIAVIAREKGTHPTTVSHIKHGRNWKHV